MKLTKNIKIHLIGHVSLVFKLLVRKKFISLVSGSSNYESSDSNKFA